MEDTDSYVMLGLGGFFLIMALGFFLWAGGEERGMNRGLSGRRDLREFLTRWPLRVEPGALRVGGRLFLATGLVLIILGGILLL